MHLSLYSNSLRMVAANMRKSDDDSAIPEINNQP
jgi:hypothetical protein